MNEVLSDRVTGKDGATLITQKFLFFHNVRSRTFILNVKFLAVPSKTSKVNPTQHCAIQMLTCAKQGAFEVKWRLNARSLEREISLIKPFAEQYVFAYWS